MASCMSGPHCVPCHSPGVSSGVGTGTDGKVLLLAGVTYHPFLGLTLESEVLERTGSQHWGSQEARESVERQMDQRPGPGTEKSGPQFLEKRTPKVKPAGASEMGKKNPILELEVVWATLSTGGR